MKFSHILKVFIPSAIIFIVIDLLWHLFIFGSYYNDSLQGLVYSDNGMVAPIPMYAILATATMVAGLMYFLPIRQGQLINKHAGLKSAVIFMLAIVGLNSFVSLALIPNWPLGATIFDLVWAVVEGLLVGMIMIKIHNKSISQANQVNAN